MERYELLKSIGFSDKFLNALNEFEKAVPNVYYELPFNDNEHGGNFFDTNSNLIIDHPNDNYNQNIIVRQG